MFSTLEDPSVPDTLLPAYNSGDSIHFSTAGYNAVGDAICAAVTFTPTIQEPSGAGDLTLTRSTVASRINSSGKYENVAINIPRLYYPISGGCPKWLQEPQRTSEFGRSMWTGGGATPTGWSKFGAGTTAVGPTTAFFEASVGVVTYTFTCSSNIAFFFNSLSVTSGTTYTWSVFIESASGLNYSDILTITGAGYSSTTYIFNGAVVSAVSPVSGTGRLELVSVCNSSGSSVFRVGAGTQGSNLTGSCTLSCPQLEVGDSASSPIITNLGATTRTADVQNTTLKPMIGQIEGTLFVEFSQPILKNNDVIQINRSVTNTVYIGTDNSGNIIVYIYASGSLISYNTNVKVTANGIFKVAVAYKSGDNYVSVNGVGFAFSNTYTFNGDLASINTFRAAYLLGAIPTCYGDIIICKTRLTNSELNAMTA